MYERITVSFEKDFAKALRDKAKSTGRTISGLTRIAITRYMEAETHD